MNKPPKRQQDEEPDETPKKRGSLVEFSNHGKRCWQWRGRIVGNGYGRIKVNGKDRAVHHVVWEECYGPIPKGMEVHHRCNNRACCRPTHLKLATPALHKRLHALAPEELLERRRTRARLAAKRNYKKKKDAGFHRISREGKMIWEKRPFCGPLYSQTIADRASY